MGTAEAAKRAIAAKVMAGSTQLTVNRFNKTQAGASTGVMGELAGAGANSGESGTLARATTPGKGNRAAELRMKHSRGQSGAKGHGSWGPPPPMQAHPKSPQRRGAPGKHDIFDKEIGPSSPMPLSVQAADAGFGFARSSRVGDTRSSMLRRAHAAEKLATAVAQGEEEKRAADQKDLLLAATRAKAATRQWSSNSLTLKAREPQMLKCSAEEAVCVVREAVKLQSAQ